MTENELKLKNTYTEQIYDESDSLFIVAHGGSKGLDSPLIAGVADALYNAGVSVVRFNFSYLSEGVKNSEGCVREVEDLWSVYQLVKQKYPDKKIHIIGKSLGGMVASWLPDRKGAKLESISLFGFVVGDVDFGSYTGPVFIIQGEKDRFGGEEVVREAMKRFQGEYELVIIPNADHSYRKIDSASEETYERQAVDALLTILRKHGV